MAQTRWGGRIGLWMMPDNVHPGNLEMLLEPLVPTAAGDWTWAAEASRIARTKGATFRVAHERKAQLHTWLAWRDPPGAPYGTALEATHLRDVSPQVDAFLEWFRRLFLAD